MEELRALALSELPSYCEELREFIIRSVSSNPGHLGSSLGAVELAVAVHYVFDTPHDRVVWDVGHQAYAHKIICGRKESFDTNRKKDGISGFPNREESPFDSFGGGHASVSISAALGMVVAAEIEGAKRDVVAIIGDGALTGGLAFEGLNNVEGRDILVILNDNNISIDARVGGLSNYLTRLTTSKSYNRLKNSVWRSLSVWPQLRRLLQKFGNGAKQFFMRHSNIFEALGFRYFGPVDGNDVVMLVRRLRDLKEIEGPKLLHALTLKGKGYEIAERLQTEWHAPGCFNHKTGERTPSTGLLRYQDVFGHTLLELARQNPKIVGITPAMPTGSSLNIMQKEFPKRVFDVGIAEGHAVTFAAGLACETVVPFCVIYSSFAQRSVDNIIHDVALQGLEVVLCLDRAGIVGEDGATHHGVFDIALLRSIPNVIISAPSSPEQLRNLMYTASKGGHGACFVIRYPRAGQFEQEAKSSEFKELKIGTSRMLSHNPNSNIALLSVGTTLQITAQAAQQIGATHVDMIYVKPLDEEMLCEIAKDHTVIVVVEDGVAQGGAGSAVRDFYAERKIAVCVRSIGAPANFVKHGTVEELHEEIGLSTKKIIEVAQEKQ